MRWMLLAAILALPAGAEAQQRMRAGEFRALAPQRIAEALLPADHMPIAAVVFERMGEPRLPAPYNAIHHVRFLSASSPLAADFCVQDEIVAEITPMPDADGAWLDSPPRLVRANPAPRLYRYRQPGAACDGTQSHFGIYDISVEQGLGAFRALVGAVRLAEARPRRPLPFTVSCDAMRCGGAHAVLGALNYSEIVSVEALRDSDITGRDTFSRWGRLPNRVAVRFSLPISGTNQTAVRAIVFRGRIEHLAVEEHNIVF